MLKLIKQHTKYIDKKSLKKYPCGWRRMCVIQRAAALTCKKGELLDLIPLLLSTSHAPNVVKKEPLLLELVIYPPHLLLVLQDSFFNNLL